jgi:hypothetical protein
MIQVFSLDSIDSILECFFRSAVEELFKSILEIKKLSFLYDKSNRDTDSNPHKYSNYFDGNFVLLVKSLHFY